MGLVKINQLLFIVIILTATVSFAHSPANSEPWSAYVFSDGRIAHHGHPDCVERMKSDEGTRINLFFVLDASSSMRKRPSGSKMTKMEIARQVLGQVLGNLPPRINCSFWVLGHRAAEKSSESCEDIEELFPLQPVNTSEILAAVENIEPTGGSPIAGCLQKIKSKIPVEGATGVILICDGGETCSGDPCAEAKSLKTARGRSSIHVAGIDVDDKERSQLACVAEKGGGQYFNVSSDDGLFLAVSGAVNSTITQTTLLVKTVAYDGEMMDENIYLGRPFSEESNFKMRTWVNNSVPAGFYDLLIGTTPLTLFQNIEIVEGHDNIINIDAGAIRVRTPQGQSTTINVTDAIIGRPLGQFEGILHFIPGLYELEVNNSKSAAIKVQGGGVTDVNLGALHVMAHDQSSIQTEFFNMGAQSLGEKTGVVMLVPGSYKIAVNSSTSDILQVEPGKTTRVVLGALHYRKSYELLDFEGANMGKFKGTVDLVPGNYTVIIPGQSPKRVAVESGNLVNIE